MNRSLRRTLAVRFAATMAVGLAVACAALYWVTGRVMEREGEAALAPAAGARWVRGEERDLLVALVAVVVAGTSATLVGAWWLAGSAVRPVQEITAQAMHIEAGSLDRRIAAHADSEEYQGLVAVLNRMLDRLDRAFRAQRRLTADVSHELRTPLTALRGLMEVALRSERKPREYQHTLRSALEEIDRLTAMSEDLLLVTRADARLISPRRVPTDLNVVVREELAAVSGRLLEKDLTSGAALDPAVPALPLDAPLVGRVVGHLLDNAIKFTPVGGRIDVATARVPAGVRFTIQDSGPGFRAEDVPHIFEPFYRADQARTTGTGAGLGLTLVSAIVRLHGGTVRAGNVNGTGARIEFELPAAIDARAERPSYQLAGNPSGVSPGSPVSAPPHRSPLSSA